MIPAGAQETQPVYYLSVDSSTDLNGLSGVDEEDIVAYDAAIGTWSMFFDASDVGLDSGDLDAFHIREDGSIVMSNSANGGFRVPGLVGGPKGKFVDDSDLFLFTPVSTGEVTAGSFSFHFDGSDVGLDDNDVERFLEKPAEQLLCAVIAKTC